MSPDDFNSSSILIKDIMSKSLISVNPATTSLQVAKMMEQAGIGAVLVRDNEINVGIVTDRDFATKIAANNLPFETPVEKIMSSPLVSITYDEPISAAAERMTSKKIRKLAVSDNGNIVGIITSTDLVNQLAK
ncbi:MAG: CBS domain-containing protein [Nitrosopumilus sp.]